MSSLVKTDYENDSGEFVDVEDWVEIDGWSLIPSKMRSIFSKMNFLGKINDPRLRFEKTKSELAVLSKYLTEEYKARRKLISELSFAEKSFRRIGEISNISEICDAQIKHLVATENVSRKIYLVRKDLSRADLEKFVRFDRTFTLTYDSLGNGKEYDNEMNLSRLREECGIEEGHRFQSSWSRAEKRFHAASAENSQFEAVKLMKSTRRVFKYRKKLTALQKRALMVVNYQSDDKSSRFEVNDGFARMRARLTRMLNQLRQDCGLLRIRYGIY